MTAPPYDVFVIGGGINGRGIARDAVGRGFSVALAEMNDLASGTSSWSTKLIHGGLRYLEQYKFRLVRQALIEREVLWASAPHIIRPLRFVLPHHSGLRPAWLLRMGLFLYDHLGGRKYLAATRVLDMTTDICGQPLKPLFRYGFEYSDCWVDDVRLVVLNARDAANRGADIFTRTMVTRLVRHADYWQISLCDATTGLTREVRSRLLVNAAGPWVDQVLAKTAGHNDRPNLRLVQGSHIVVKQRFTHDRAYIFQNADKRIIFAIPYEQDLTLIGTTDRDYDGDPGRAEITAEETDYLCQAASAYFRIPIGRDDIVWRFSGVRALFDDGTGKAQETTRDYLLSDDIAADSTAILINVFGGKITTYRTLAETLLTRIEARLGRRQPAWTKNATLPGGNFPITGKAKLTSDLCAQFPFLRSQHAARLINAYGTLCWQILKGVRQRRDLGRCFGHDLTAVEVDYLIEQEWVTTADDLLWRRSKLGLRLSPQEKHALDDYIQDRLSATA